MSLAIAADPVPLTVDPYGVVRVSGSRVTLDTIVVAHQQGETPESIADQYPTVAISDIYAVIGFYLRHRREVDAYLEEQRKRAAAIRAGHESRLPPEGIRERLLERRGSSQEP
jgi:uncharacterized protein (DUF433 family)